MICKCCGYNSETNSEESDWDFWEFADVNFEFERREFSDFKQVMNSKLKACPKCFTLQIEPTEVKEVELQ